MGILPVAMVPQTSLEMTRSVVTHTLTAIKKTLALSCVAADALRELETHSSDSGE